jgi:hypothetical protein
MSSTVRYTDLSFELPSLRANVEVPLEDFEFWAYRAGTSDGADPGWRDAWSSVVRDENSWWPGGLEDL